MKRHYFTIFAIKSQLKELTAVWKIKRKLLIENKEAASETFSWREMYAKRGSHYKKQAFADAV